MVGYQVLYSESNQLDLVGGVRYLYIRVPQTFTINENFSKKVTLGGHHWDGVVGLRGVKTINDKWYFDYYGDVGAGDSKLTWQAKVGFGYQFKKITGTFGFRYLRFDFKKDAALADLAAIGPNLGAKWTF